MKRGAGRGRARRVDGDVWILSAGYRGIQTSVFGLHNPLCFPYWCNMDWLVISWLMLLIHGFTYIELIAQLGPISRFAVIRVDFLFLFWPPFGLCGARSERKRT